MNSLVVASRAAVGRSGVRIQVVTLFFLVQKLRRGCNAGQTRMRLLKILPVGDENVFLHI